MYKLVRTQIGLDITREHYDEVQNEYPEILEMTDREALQLRTNIDVMLQNSQVKKMDLFKEPGDN